MTNNRPYVLWRRVSTKQQGESQLGLEAQTAIAEYFMHGEPVKVFTDVYSGTKLKECRNLQLAMKYCKEHGYLLVVAKTDRIRNTVDGLSILDEMGEGNVVFCDLQTTDRTILTMMFAMWERQAIMGCINTKLGLEQARKRGVRLGRPADHIDENGKEVYDVSAMVEAASLKRTDTMIKWREESQAVSYACLKRAEGWKIQQIVDEIGKLYDGFKPKKEGDENPWATPNGCKPQKGTISKWLREANPLLLAV